MKKGEKQTTNQVTLNTVTRTVLGKKVKKLRKEGNLPGNIFGNDFKSTAVSVKYADFTHVYKIVHETGIVYLKLDKDEIPVMIKHIQRHPINSSAVHVDFRKVDLSKKIIAEVPVKVIGTSEAVTQKGGVLLTQSSHLSVEALPQDIPTTIEVDISSLKELGTDIKVGDLSKTNTYVITTDPGKVIVSVTAHKEESIVAETAAVAAPEVITAKAEETEVTDETKKPGAVEKAPQAEKEKKEPAKK